MGTEPSLKKSAKHTNVLPSSDTATSSVDKSVLAYNVAVKSVSDDSVVLNTSLPKLQPTQDVAHPVVLTLPGQAQHSREEPPQSDARSIGIPGESGPMSKMGLFFGGCCEGMCCRFSQNQVGAQPKVIDATIAVMEKLQGHWMDAKGEQHTIDALSQMVHGDRRKGSPFSFEDNRITIHGKRRKKEGMLE